MKKIIILLAAGLACIDAFAGSKFGVFTPSETTYMADETTGITLKVLTDTTFDDRFIYQTDPMWTMDGKYLLFRSSSRSGIAPEKRTRPDGREFMFRPTLFYFCEVATGRIIQVSDESIGSVYLSDKKLYQCRRKGEEWQLLVMDLDVFFRDAERGKAAGKGLDAYLKPIGTFPQSREMGRPGGWCVSCDDRYAYITVSRDVEPTAEELAIQERVAQKPRPDQPVKVGQGMSGIRKMDLRTGEVSIICDVPFRVGHIQSSRFRPEEILFCCETGGDAGQRMWYCDAGTGEYKPLYKETPLDWVTHETFGTEDYVYFNVLGWQDRLRKQASGIFRINLRTDDVECLGNVEMDKDRTSALTGRGFWHCNSSRDNKWATGDTFAGSVWIINVATGHRYQIASDLKMAPDHAQPFFSPDGTKLCFQSGHYSGAQRLNLIMVDLNELDFFRQYDK